MFLIFTLPFRCISSIVRHSFLRHLKVWSVFFIWEKESAATSCSSKRYVNKELPRHRQITTRHRCNTRVLPSCYATSFRSTRGVQPSDKRWVRYHDFGTVLWISSIEKVLGKYHNKELQSYETLLFVNITTKLQSNLQSQRYQANNRYRG